MAIKKIKRTNLLYNFQSKIRDLREIALSISLKHENIVKTYSCYSKAKKWYQFYIVMELCTDTLKNKMSERLSEVEIRNFLWQICKGLSYMHGQGLVHRDLKPENILFIANTLKIADFSFLRYLDPTAPNKPEISFPGTSFYKSPQIIAQKPKYTAKTDI